MSQFGAVQFWPGGFFYFTGKLFTGSLKLIERTFKKTLDKNLFSLYIMNRCS